VSEVTLAPRVDPTEPLGVDWIAHDEQPLEALPGWARVEGEVLDGKPYRVTLLPEGIVLERAGRRSALRWDEVLVPIRVDEPRRLLLAASREPPRVPWFELRGLDVPRIEREVRLRLEAVDHRGYRERRRSRKVMPADEVLTEVLDHRPLPGAVEIPRAHPSVVRSAFTGGSIGAATLGFYGLLFGPGGMLLAGGVGAVSGAALMGGIEAVRRRNAGRVLVLTPDAFVGGLDGKSIRAVPWFRVGRFVDGVDPHGESALEVWSPDDELVARAAARFFGQPLDVIVAVAEAYRKRASDER